MTNYDPLELELAVLRPQEPSEDLKHRIAERLAEPALHRADSRTRRFRRMAVTAGVLAASAMAVIVWRGDVNTTETDACRRAIESDLSLALDSSYPSIWSYGRALRQSTESFDGLLDRHSRQMLSAPEDAPPLMRLASFVSNKHWIVQGEL
jgi:hypothetical protein